MNNTTFEEGYCGVGLKNFREEFVKIYGTIATVICSLGLIANAINILVFSSKTMKRFHINLILLGISVADQLRLISSLLHTILNYGVLNIDICVAHSYHFQTLSHVSNWINVNFHCTSVTLTILLAVWRYIGVAYPIRFRQFFTGNKTTVAVLLCYLFVPISNTMCYMAYDVVLGNTTNTNKLVLTMMSKRTENSSNCSIYDLQDTAISRLGNGVFGQTAWWLLAVLFQILPPIILIVFSIIFARVLYLSSKKRSSLTNNMGRKLKLNKSSLKSTKMVLVITVSSSYTVLLIITAALGEEFRESCYRHLVEIFDIIEIINNSSHLIIYISMCKQFRRSFKNLFLWKTFKDRDVKIKTVQFQSKETRFTNKSQEHF
ncbi:hypothetical protein CHUAL_007691 [Chamberlinius hualienensis]